MDTIFILIIIGLFWLGSYQILNKNSFKKMFFKINIIVLILYSVYYTFRINHWDENGFGATLFFTYTILTHTAFLFIFSLISLFWENDKPKS